jgi:uncharacterized protein involved in exopolysaccharide biosynthesis
LTTPRPRSNEPLSVSPPVEPIRPEPIRPEPRPASDEFSVISLINTVLRHRWLILIIAVAVAGYQAYKAYRMPLVYSAEAQFMPKGSRGQTQLQGLAQQFGIPVSSGDAAQSPAFYMDLLESRPLLAAVAEQQYRIRNDKGVVRTGTLAELYGIRDANPTLVRTRVVNRLKGQVNENVSNRTGVITVSVWSGYPELSVQIVRNLLDQVNVFNLNRRQEQAGAERAFIEKRLAEAQSQLSQAENNLQVFLTENRDFRSSPTLTLEFDRLNRAVTSRQALYNGLATSYEQAKIEEVRDLPVITVLEPPEMPISADPRGGKRKALLGLLIGLMGGIIIAFVIDRLAVNKTVHSDEFAEFANLKRDVLADLTNPLSRVTKVISSRKRS